MSDGYLGHFTS